MWQFITKCDSYYKLQQLYYKMQRLVQIAIVQQFNASTSGVSNTSNFKFQISWKFARLYLNRKVGPYRWSSKIDWINPVVSRTKDIKYNASLVEGKLIK